MVSAIDFNEHGLSSSDAIWAVGLICSKVDIEIDDWKGKTTVEEPIWTSPSGIIAACTRAACTLSLAIVGGWLKGCWTQAPHMNMVKTEMKKEKVPQCIVRGRFVVVKRRRGETALLNVPQLINIGQIYAYTPFL